MPSKLSSTPSTPFTSVKDRAQFFANQPIMGSKGPQAPGTISTIRGGTSVVGNSTASSSSASALGGGEIGVQHVIVMLKN